MDLGSRVKKALFDPEGTVASHGESDIHNTPGAYPDTPANESGPDTTTNTSGTGFDSSKPTHNKLHKPEDPRGWVGDTKAGLNHKHTDSGVGFTEAHDTSPARQTGDYTYSAQDNHNTTSGGLDAIPPTAATRNVGGQQQQDRTQLSRAPGDADVQKSHDDSYRGASLGSGGIVPLLDSHRDDEMRDEEAHNHHHNHGDSDAKKTRQPGDVVQDHPYWGDLPRGGGVYNSVTGHGSDEDQRKRQQELYQQETSQRETQGLSGQHPSTVASLSDSRDAPHSHQQTTGLGDSYRDTSKVGERDNSHKKEALMGAGGAATASAAAATAYRMHERDNNNKTVQDPTREEHPSEDKTERRRSFGLFHRSNKEDDHQHHHAKEKAKEDRTKHVDEPKTEKKHSFGGLFHRNSGDKDTVHDDSGARDLKRDDNSNTAAYTMAGAGLGAGGAVAYMGTRDRKDDRDRDEVKDRSPIGGQQHQPHHHQQHQPIVGAHDHHQTQSQTLGGTHTQPQRQYQQDQPHQATRGLDEQYDTQNNNRNMTGAAAAAAAGLGAGAGAGALAYRHRDEKANEPREETIKSRHQVTPGDHTLRHTSHASNNLTGNVNPLVGSTRDTQTQRQPPALTGHANRGDYSHLSSGTASGVDPTAGSSSVGTAHSNSNNSNQAPTLTEHANRGDYSHLSSGSASGVGAMLGSSATSARDTHSNSKSHNNEHNTTPAEHANHGDYRHLASGTTSGVEPIIEPSSASSARTKQAPPALAEHANHGEYNVLSSGTPSGVRLDNGGSEDKNSASYNLQPSLPEAREGEHGNNNNRFGNTAAVGTLAGAAGLGAAAHQTRDRHHVGDDQNVERRELEKLKPAEEAQVKRFEREEARGDDGSQARSFPLVPGAAGSHHKSDKVIHRCQKCGEENDISSYFKRN